VGRGWCCRVSRMVSGLEHLFGGRQLPGEVAASEHSAASESARGELPLESREHWLVLSYWANVDGMACSHHIDDRLKHLRRLGVEPEVITGTCGPRPRGWAGRWHRVPSVTATGYQFEVRQLTRPMRKPWRRLVRLLLTLPVLPLYSMEKHVARLHSTFGWCISAAAVGVWATRNERHGLIYSTGGEMSAHVAAALVARVRRLPWVAEMQDPIVYQGFGHSHFSPYTVTGLPSASRCHHSGCRAPTECHVS